MTKAEREACIAQFRKMRDEGVELNRYERTFLDVAEQLDRAVGILGRYFKGEHPFYEARELLGEMER